MSRFKRIKNKTTKKSSVSIDEKIAALNKELEKTGMLSERMTTSNVYSTSTFVPADPGGEFPIPDTTGVTGSGFTQPVSGDPNDPSNWPNAYTDNSWMRNPNTVNGEANQPIIASFDDALFATDTSGRYPTGGAGIAFGNQAFGVSVGYIRNGFYRQVLKPGLLGGTVTVPQDASGAPYFGLFGEYFPADETRQKILKMASARYAAVNVAGATTIPVKAWTPHNTFHMGPFADYSGPKVTVDGQNYVLQTFQMYTKSNTFYVNATPATTTNPIFRGIGDIEYHGPITPGRLFGLSNQGYNYLDGRSRKKKEDEGTFDADGNYIPPGFENAIGTDEIIKSNQGTFDDDGNYYPPGFNPDDLIKTNEIDTTPEPEPETDEEDLTPADIPDEFKTDSQDKPSAQGVTLTKWMSRADFMKMYPNAITGEFINGVYVDEYLDALPYGSTDFMSPNPDFPGAWDLNTRAYNNYIMTGDLSGLGNKSGTPKPRHQRATPEPEQKMYGGKTYEELMADLDATIEKYSAIEKEAYDEMRSIALELGMDFVSLIGGLFTGGTTAYPVLSKLGLKLLRKYGKTVAGKMIRKLIKRFRTKKNSQKLDELLDDIDNGRPPKPKDKLPDDMEYVWSDTGTGNKKGWNVRFKEKSTKIPPKPTDQLPKTHEFKWDGNQWVARRKVGSEVSGSVLPPKTNQQSGSMLPPPKGPKPGEPGSKYDAKGRLRYNPLNYNRQSGKTPKYDHYQLNGDLLNEAAKLGHFEPEELNVDIEKLRKGIMPEYPKKPPAKMVDGYHQDSKLKPKELNKEPYLKIDEKDLIRNHRLKPNEAQQMMKTIDRINDHIKKHPEDLIHAQMRYPVDDPRLAELNWRMDQMLDAGEEYLDSNFKVNDKLFKRAIDRTKNNIKLTDPEYVQQNYNELRGTTQGKIINPKPRDIKLKSKLKKYLPQYESKSFFKHVDSNDYKKISQRKEEQKKLKLANETILNKVTKERQEYIDGEMSKQMSDWRKDISESDFTNITKGNKVSQTFQHTSGATITLDGALGGKMMVPSQVTIEIPGEFGEPGFPVTVDGPTESDFGLAGFTKPLDKKVMQKQSVKTAKEINDQIDASEKASESKSARVPIETGDLGYKSTDEILADVGDLWTYDEYMDQLNALSDRYAKIAEPLEKVKLDYIYNKHEDVPIEIVDAIDAITKALHQAQEALHQAWERYNKIPDLPPVPDEGKDEGEDEDIGKKHSPILNAFNNAPRSVRAPLKLFVGYLTNTIKGNAAQVLDQKDINSAWENTYIDVDNNSLSVDGYMQNVFGGESLSQLSLDGNTAKLKFGFKPHINAKEFAQHPDKYNFLQRQVINSLGPYVADLQVGPGILKPIGGVIASKATEISKMLGGGKNLEGEITMSISKLKKLNPDVYDYLIKKKKVNESNTFSKIKKFKNK